MEGGGCSLADAVLEGGRPKRNVPKVYKQLTLNAGLRAFDM